MRYLLTLCILFSTILAFAQGDKGMIDAPIEASLDSLMNDSAQLVTDTIPTYKSLFWKIEHPNHEKPSYLYGTMHVSHKIAYHLKDDFFQALKDVDQIALETNPEDWMDKMLENSNRSNSARMGGLYKTFAAQIPEKDDIKKLLQMNNQIVNSILYRNNEYQQNFEEETYLDMFIFQAGGKMGKPVVALEDIDEADILAKKASVSAYDSKREYSPWLKKKLQESGVVELTEDAYRTKNLDLIDSLNREYYSFEYNDFMLYQRNRNMVVALDSVLEKGTVLIGIGAAHLPGEDGVIDMLRKKGFTVTPIEGELTDKGKAIKENFENSFAERTHKTYESADGFLTLSLPDELYEFGIPGKNIGLSLDITNGAYFTIFRTPRNKEIAKEVLTLDDIEEILYENIPGKIKKQERIIFQGYPALSVANETKSGEHQKYLIVATDLEIIIMKLGGKKDYASQNEDKFFNAIQLKQNDNKEHIISPFYGDFQVKMKGTPIITGNSKILSNTGTVKIESIDTINGAYYFAQSMVYYDLKYFEEDEFEVEYMHKVWYDEIDTTHTSIQTNLSNIPFCISSSSTSSGQQIWLKSIKKGPRYYMLGTVGLDSLTAHDYFNTFEYVPYIHVDEKYEERIDTALCFKVTSSIEAPPFFDYYGKKEDADTVSNIYKSVSYETPYKEFINVNYRKYHSYYQVENVDSIWTYIDRRWATDEDKENGLEQFDKVIGTTEEGYPTYQFKVKQRGSSRIINNHYYLNHGLVYLLQYDSDKFTEPSPFINQFIETFDLKDTIIGRSPLGDKTELFFENIYSTDSLTRAQALASYNYVDFTKKEIPQLMKVIKDFDFTDKELNIKVGILEALGSLEDPRVFAFLRDLYINSEYNSIIQLEVISALVKSPSEANMKSILSLMKEDIPLSSERSIRSAFSPLSDSLSWNYSKLLFPEIMEYSSISEYKTWIYKLAVLLKDAGMIKPKLFKKYNKQLVNETKIEFKRQKTKDLNKKSNGHSGYSGGSSLLNEYISLLIPCYKEAEIKELFDKISFLESPRLRSVLQAQLARNNFAINDTLIQKLAEDPKTRKYLFDSFDKMDQMDKFPSEYLNQRDLAESFIISSSSYPKIDSTEFIKEVFIDDKEDQYVIYFFKTMKKGSDYGYDEEKERDWGIQYIAYHLKEGVEIIKKYYAKASYEEIDFEDAKEMKEYEEKAVDKVKYKKRKRVVSYNDGYYDEY